MEFIQYEVEKEDKETETEGVKKMALEEEIQKEADKLESLGKQLAETIKSVEYNMKNLPDVCPQHVLTCKENRKILNKFFRKRHHMTYGYHLAWHHYVFTSESYRLQFEYKKEEIEYQIKMAQHQLAMMKERLEKAKEKSFFNEEVYNYFRDMRENNFNFN